MPVARLLGEKVAEKCAVKLKPYLIPAMKSLGTTVDDYSKAVATVLQARSEAVEPSEADAVNENVVVYSLVHDDFFFFNNIYLLVVLQS